MTAVRLTERDIEVLKWLSKFRYLSTTLIAKFFFDNRLKVARRRLKLLSDRNYINWFLKTDHCHQGRLERVWHLSKKKKAETSYLLGADKPSFYKPPQNPLFVNHHLKICEFILCLKENCDASGEYSFQFFIEHENHKLGKNRQEHSGLPVIGRNKTFFVPDCLLILQNSRGTKSLMFIEVDLSSETLLTTSEDGKDVFNKISAYMDYLVSQEYRYLCEDFDFKGFRLLLVTTSQARLNRVVELCGEIDTRGIVWITTFDKMETMFSPIWRVPCSKHEELQSIVKNYSEK